MIREAVIAKGSDELLCVGLIRERERESLCVLLLVMVIIMGFMQLPDPRPMTVVLALLVALVGHALYHVLWRGVVLGMWWRSRRARRIFQAQGVKCLPRPFPFGNVLEMMTLNAQARSLPMPKISHDIVPRISPHLDQWSKLHGERFVFWVGAQPRFMLTEPDQAKELLSSKYFGLVGKPQTRPDDKDLIGLGLATLEGEKWAQHRRIISPSFFLEKLKGLAPTMVACTKAMMQAWESRVERKEVIDVFAEFRELTADIIARSAFGSSFGEGKQVFEMQHEQAVIFAKTFATVYIPGSRSDNRVVYLWYNL